MCWRPRRRILPVVKTALTVLAGVVVVLVVFLVARGGLDLGALGSGGGSGTSGGRGPGGPVVDPTPGRPVEPTVDPGGSGDQGGTPTATFRGTNGADHLDCDSVSSELKVGANGGRIRWTASAPSGVTVSPSSGELDEDDSRVLRIGGAYAGSRSFTVVVSAPNRAGSGSVRTAFTCD
jgi:hypothetical protein